MSKMRGRIVYLIFILLLAFNVTFAQEAKENHRDCQKDSGKVCGQPPMPPCPKGQMCAQVMPQAKFYESDCALEEAGAKAIPPSACQEKKKNEFKKR